MALIYTTGTINQPDAGSVGLAMVEKIRDDLVAHPAWELVEEFTPGGGAVRWYVFKCLATESGLPSDYFVVIGRTLGTGELRAFICEGYNSGTHVATNWAQASTSSSMVLDASGRNTANYTLGTTAITGTTNPIYIPWIPSGVSTKWWIVAAEDGFTVAFNGASNGFFHFGAYTPLSDVANPMPICCVCHLSSSSGFVTRNPSLASVSIKGAALQIFGNGYNNGFPLGFQGSLSHNDKLQNDQRPVAEVGIVTIIPNTGDQALFGWALGKQKRMRMGESGSTPAGFSFGDAYVFEGRLWVPYLPTDHRMWDTGVAA